MKFELIFFYKEAIHIAIEKNNFNIFKLLFSMKDIEIGSKIICPLFYLHNSKFNITYSFTYFFLYSS